MVLTRSASESLASQTGEASQTEEASQTKEASQTDEASQTEESVTTPKKTARLSESSSSSPSPRKLPTPRARAELKSFVCEVCRNVSSKSTVISDSLINFSSFPKSNESDANLNVVLNDLHYKIELVGERISAIESSIFNHNAIIRDLQGEFSSFTNKFNTLTSKLSEVENSVSSFSKVTLNTPSYSLNVNSNGHASSSYTSISPSERQSSSVPLYMVASVPHSNSSATSSSPPVTSRTPPQKCSLLVIGDSNTKYTKFPNTSYHRVPTYLVEDINPGMCIGHAKVWIHVGINNLKSIRCRGLDDVHRTYELFMHKIEQIGILSPKTTVIVSPILPSGVSVLNERARAFNRLLFSTKRWFTTLNFNSFANRYSMLDKSFRCYGNPRDKIHLGSQGIRNLEHLIAQKVSLVDSRSYRAVAKSNIT